MPSDELLVSKKQAAATATTVATEGEHTQEFDQTSGGDHAQEFGYTLDPFETEHENDEEKKEFHLSSKSPTCPHYRSLTSKVTASLAHSTFIPNAKTVNCCCNGGEKTSMGLHGIEYLVMFGMMPHVSRNFALYRYKDVNDVDGGAPFGIF